MKRLATFILIAAVGMLVSTAPLVADEPGDDFGTCSWQEPDLVCTFASLTITIDWDESQVCGNGSFECTGDGITITGTVNRCLSFQELIELLMEEEEEGGDGNEEEEEE